MVLFKWTIGFCVVLIYDFVSNVYIYLLYSNMLIIQYTKDADCISVPPYPTAVIVYSATWCQPCKQLHQMLLNYKSNIPVLKIDVEKCPKTSEGIRSLPTVVFKKNKKVIGTVQGFDETKVRKFLSMLD